MPLPQQHFCGKVCKISNYLRQSDNQSVFLIHKPILAPYYFANRAHYRIFAILLV